MELPNDISELKQLVYTLIDEIVSLKTEVATLKSQVASLEKENAALRKENTELKQENILLKIEISELKARLNQNSSNSSKPPSSDYFNRKPAFPKTSVGKKGGQSGHKGDTLKQIENPDKIVECRSEQTLKQLENQFEKYDLVICDEFGYISFDKEGAELLFSHLSLRAGIKSTIITTNLSFDRWNEIFGDTILTAAMVDRLTHKAHLINMNGKSYRTKETLQYTNKLSENE